MNPGKTFNSTNKAVSMAHLKTQQQTNKLY